MIGRWICLIWRICWAFLDAEGLEDMRRYRGLILGVGGSLLSCTTRTERGDE